MIKEAIDRILSLADPWVKRIGDIDYTNRPLTRISLPGDAEPNALTVSSLASLAEMVMSEANEFTLPIVITVDSPETVTARSSIKYDKTRDTIFCAKAYLPKVSLNNFNDLQTAIIQLRSVFTAAGDRDAVLANISKVTGENTVVTADDGISQTVEVKTGISLVKSQPLKPIVKLAPYRTFREVEQPASDFLLRIREGGGVGLFEADGGCWQLAAKANIAKFLRDRLAEVIESNMVLVTE